MANTSDDPNDSSNETPNTSPDMGGGSQENEGGLGGGMEAVPLLERLITEYNENVPNEMPVKPSIVSELGEFVEWARLGEILDGFDFGVDAFECPKLELKELKRPERYRYYSEPGPFIKVIGDMLGILEELTKYVQLPQDAIEYLTHWAALAFVRLTMLLDRLAFLKAASFALDGERNWPKKVYGERIFPHAVRIVRLIHLVQGIEVGPPKTHEGAGIAPEVDARVASLHRVEGSQELAKKILSHLYREGVRDYHGKFMEKSGKKRQLSAILNMNPFGYGGDEKAGPSRADRAVVFNLDDDSSDSEEDHEVETTNPNISSRQADVLNNTVQSLQQAVDAMKETFAESFKIMKEQFAQDRKQLRQEMSELKQRAPQATSGNAFVPMSASTPAPPGPRPTPGVRTLFASLAAGQNSTSGAYGGSPSAGGVGGPKLSEPPPSSMLKVVSSSSDRGIPKGYVNRSSYVDRLELVRQGRPRRDLFREGGSYTGDRFIVKEEHLLEMYINLPYPYNVVPYRKKEKPNIEYSKMVQFDSRLKLDGSIDSFLNWSPAFLSSIHIVKDLSEIEKVFCLRQSIDFDGPAGHELTVIFSNDYSVVSYFEILGDIVKKFGDPDILLAQQQQKLQTYRLDCNSYHSVNKFYYMLKRYAMSQEHIGESTILDNTTLLANMLGCFVDKREKRAFTAFCKSKNVPEGLNAFILFIQKNVQELESLNVWDKFDTRSLMQTSKAKPAQRGYSYVTAEEDIEHKTEYSHLPEGGLEHTNEVDAEEEANAAFKVDTVERSCDVPVCTEKHPLWKCDKFSRLPLKEKTDVVVKAKRCFRCLGFGHVLKECKNKYGGCKKCKDDSHHTAMCKALPFMSIFYSYEYLPYFNHESFAPSVDRILTVKETANQKTSCSVSLRTIPIVFINKNKNKRLVFVTLMDDGSTGMYLSRRACELLGLEGKCIEIVLSTVANKLVKISTIQTTVNVESLDGTFESELTVVVLDDMVEDLTPVEWNDAKKNFPHLKDIKFPELPSDWPANVDCIIGVRRPDLTQCLREISGPPGHPIARLTPFGYTAVGPASPDAVNEDLTNVNLIYRAYDQNIIENGVGVSETGENFCFKSGELVSALKGDKSLKISSIYTAPEFVEGDATQLFDENELENRMLDLERGIAKFWEAEDLPTGNNLTIANQYIEDKMKQGFRIVDGKVELPCTWRPGQPGPELVNNRRVTYASLKRLVSKFTPELWGFYNNVFKEWLEEKIIEEVAPGDGTQDGIYYLDHFGVLRPDKPTCPIRPVLNAKKKFKGVSLNDCLLEGPNRLNDLRIVLLRAFLEDYILTADIKGMFLQIKMRELDQDYHRILWQGPEDKMVREYRFLRHVFGNKGSPFVSQFCIQHAAELMKEKYPRAVEVIQKSTLMDDNFDSFATYEEMVETNKGMLAIYTPIGMKLTKYASNSKEFMKSIDSDVQMPVKQIEPIQEDSTDKDGKPLPQAKVLGMQIDFENDIVTYKIKDKLLDVSGVWTKRRCSSIASSVYDPLGRISPVLLKGRVLLQSLWWVADLGWDDVIPEKVKESWIPWLESLVDLKTLKIQRPLKIFKKVVKNRILLGFGDASQTAYGICIYLRVEYDDGTASCHLAFASARVSPLNKYTIPRLELMAASHLVKNMAFVNKALELPKESLLYFSDSHTALAWISATTRTLKDSISYTVANIQREVPSTAWNYIKTDQNPADIASRGMSAKDLANSTLWWNGPDFCNQNELILPPFPTHLDRDSDDYLREVLTEKDIVLFTCEVPKSLGPSVFPVSADHMSDLNKLIRIAALCLRFILHKKSPIERFSPYGGFINVFEYRRALETLIYVEQQRWFPDIFGFLRKYGQIKRGSPLAQFDPFIEDFTGLLRSRSRVQYSDFLPDWRKFPIILPQKSSLTLLLINYYHRVVCGHYGGVGMTFEEISLKYVSVALKESIGREIRFCRKCQDLNAKPMGQKMAPLPLERLPTAESGNTVFEACGLDYFGPFMISQGRGMVRRKRWVLLFCCMRFRAVRLEVTQDYSTDWTIKAIQSFLARNPTPKKFLSDQGSQLKAAAGAISALMFEKEAKKVADSFPEIDWDFIPVATPHFGGAWERLVGLAKRCLLGLDPALAFTDLEFTHYVTRVEGFLNRRPLSYTLADNNSLMPLTPNHFLAGKALEGLGLDGGIDLESSYNKVLKALDLAWRRYLREIIPQLRSMTKWKRERDGLCVGDVVMILTEANDRGTYPLASVVEVDESKDGAVRQVLVRMAASGKMKNLSLKHMCHLKLKRNVAQDYF